MRHFQLLLAGIVLLFEFLTLPVCAQPESPKPKLIIDTEAVDGKDAAVSPKPKEPDPKLSKQNINIGNYYLKQKNYDAAIERYREAIEYQPKSILANEALERAFEKYAQDCEKKVRAYEKKGEITKAISTYKSFLEKNPDSPDASDFRLKLAKLEKKTN
jgi:tetratricopeptide (TPR) repeat protein